MFLSAAIASLLLVQAPAQKPFEFKDGDRIVWLGSTLVEREQRYGYWETALLAANADKKITVRNLGWSGDTVHGEARGRFDFANPDACFKQLVNLTLELKPTVIFICYGTNESFEGKEGLPKFEKGLNKLLDALKATNARIVLFTPLPFEFQNYADRNTMLKEYAAVIQKVAEKRDLLVADVGARIDSRRRNTMAVLPPITENGMHLSESGYKATDEDFLAALGIRPWDADATALERWRTLNTTELRNAVIAKNELFFHRWRPENETYLFGFRKHEQGKNAKEVAEFDPLVTKAEEEIEKIRKTLKK
jgi:lysophospholipase L1-like esterase